MRIERGERSALLRLTLLCLALLRLALASLTLTVVAGCFATGPRAPARAPPHPVVLWDSTPAAEAVDRAALENLPDPAARSEPRSESGNFSPYVVFGQTYNVLPSGEGYVEEGVASWYGTKFNGRATASGETYDMFTLTAAHKTLPIPCYVRVTNLRNARTTIVRVNDRGPFHDERVMDLSFAAAVKLGFDLQGTAPVKLEVVAAAQGSPIPRTQIARADSTPSPLVIVPNARVEAQTVAMTAPAFSAASDGALFLQAGAFRSREGAERLRTIIRRVLGTSTQVAFAIGSDAVHRVRVGPLFDMDEASRVQNKLIEANLGVALIVRN